ncbi:MAG: UDP-glucose dehydrogenase family protein [Candidatus Hodarchaeota archaeon]
MITIIGSGYVGLTYAAGLTSKGFNVNLVDVKQDIVDMVNKGISPIWEPNLETLLDDAVRKGLLKATTKLGDVFRDSELFLVCVGTYCDDEGNIDLSQVKAVANDLKDLYKDDVEPGYKVICVKSTVICGTTDGVVLPIIKESGKKVGSDFGLAMSPEFLKEGSALEDILHPDKIVIGGWDEKSIKTVRSILGAFLGENQDELIIETDLRTAELIKYAQNSLLATKISFINEMSRFAELFGVNVGDIARAVGMDSRISPKFLNAGPGFGGSCFPKDVMALYSAGKKAGYDPLLLKAILDVNRNQKEHVVELLAKEIILKDASVSILGLAFKANTGDTRKSVCRVVIPRLIELGVKKLKVHDVSPEAREEIMKDFPPGDKISYHEEIVSCIKDTNACIILTEWVNYKELSPTIFGNHLTARDGDQIPVVLDTRRLYNPKDFKDQPVKLVILGESKDRSYIPK